MKLSRTLLLLTPAMFMVHNVSALATTSFFRPWDVAWNTDYWPEGSGYKKFKLAAQLEYGDTDDGWNYSNNKSGVLGMYQDSQSAIAATFGAAPCSALDDLSRSLSPALSPATDDGCRGRLCVDGRYQEFDVTLHGQYNFLVDGIDGFFDVSLYVPFVDKKVTNVQWRDLTNTISSSDLYIRDELTCDIDRIAEELGCGLNIRDFHTAGLGDPVVMLRWFNDYQQPDRKRLKKVRLTGRIGLTLPCSPKPGEDHAFAVPRGYDGATGVPITLGLDLFFVHNLKFIGEFELFKLFDEIRSMRLKTDVRQTDFLLFNKGIARKKYGMAWKFHLGLGVDRFLGGLSANVAYRYQRRDTDRLDAHSNFFSNDIINTAQSLQDTSFHNLLFQLRYDLFEEAKTIPVKSQFMLFYKASVGGRRSVNADTFGGQLTLNF